MSVTVGGQQPTEQEKADFRTQFELARVTPAQAAAAAAAGIVGTPAAVMSESDVVNTKRSPITSADAISGAQGAFIGEVRVLSDGVDKGSCVRWFSPTGASSPSWCWDIYPQSVYGA